MKIKNSFFCHKRLAVTLLAVLLCGVQPAQPVMATMHYDRRQTVAAEEFEAVPEAFSAAGTGKASVNKKAWKKINGICYNGSGQPIPGAITRGIDVSEWQGEINWKKVKSSDVDFAFVRIAYGLTRMDKRYDYNMEEAELAGVPVGTYVYSTAVSTAGALKEAQMAIREMDGYKVSYPVAYDLEDATLQKLPKKTIADMALTFCNEVRKAGYYPIVYCNTYWYDNFIDWSKLSGLDVWIARYGDTIQAPDKSKYSYTIWQSTDGNTENGLNATRGLIAGIPSGNDIDVDFGYVDYTKKITPRWNAVSSYIPADRPDTGDLETQKNGLIQENGYLYYYVNGEKMIRWQQINGNKYYFKPNGAAIKGLKRIDGKYYWFHTTKGYMYIDRKVIRSNGDIYFFGEDGAALTGGMSSIVENGVRHTYYFGKDGKAHKGWLTYKGKKYYFYNGTGALSGTRAENITLTSSRNIVSVFDRNGVCVKQYKKK